MKGKHHKWTRSAGAALFILIAAAPVVLALLFLYRQAAIRHEMKERLKKEALVTIFVPGKELHWVKQDKEIMVGEEMFDVKKVIRSGAGFIVTGLYDHQEKRIRQQLKNAIEGEEEKGASHTIEEILFKKDFVSRPSDLEDPCTEDIHSKPDAVYPPPAYCAGIHQVPSPPPRWSFL